MKLLHYLFAIIILSACSSESNSLLINNQTELKNDSAFWILIENQDQVSKHVPFGYTSGYINKQGDTMIALDKYSRCYTDTFYHYAIIFDSDRGGFIGINKKEEKLFNAVQTGDAYFIEESDGMIMIEENGKYGFANHLGEIIVQPQYSCVTDFHNGKAKVSYACSQSEESDDEHRIMKMNSWFYIDKEGKRCE